MVWLGRDLKDHLVPTSLPWTGTSSTRLGCSELNPTWPSLGNLCQCLTTLMVKNVFLISNLNLPSCSLEPFPLVLSLHTLVKSPSPSFLWAPFRYWKAALRSPWTLLQAEQPQLYISVPNHHIMRLIWKGAFCDCQIFSTLKFLA